MKKDKESSFHFIFPKKKKKKKKKKKWKWHCADWNYYKILLERAAPKLERIKNVQLRNLLIGSTTRF